MSLMVLKSRCWQGLFLLEDPGENLFPAPSSFWQLLTFLGLCYITQVSASWSVVFVPSLL